VNYVFKPGVLSSILILGTEKEVDQLGKYVGDWSFLAVISYGLIEWGFNISLNGPQC